MLRQGVDGISCALIVVFLSETRGVCVFGARQAEVWMRAVKLPTRAATLPLFLTSLPPRQHIKKKFHSQILSSLSLSPFLFYLSHHE